MTKALVIDYYTDVLCVWAWIAQRRIDELNQQFKDTIEIQYHYMDVFGDVATKMNTQWQSKGGVSAFAKHVSESAAAFDDAVINENIWRDVRPSTSANAHLVLKAIEIAYDKSKSVEMALKFRQAFFINALDIGKFDVLYELIKANALDANLVHASINNGSAIAALMTDYQKSKQQNLKGSPSYVMNNGRQTLYGNVGYRVLCANIEEVLKNPSDEASWC